jgi:hypothetical protein
VVVGYGGFQTREADFYLVDIDKRTIRRIMINWNPRVGRPPKEIDLRQVVWIDQSAGLDLDELNPLIRRMNYIWRHGVSDQRELQPLDSAPALVLLDEGLAFDDEGTSTHAPDKILSSAVYDLAKRHGLTIARGTPTAVPCDPESTPPG